MNASDTQRKRVEEGIAEAIASGDKLKEVQLVIMRAIALDAWDVVFDRVRRSVIENKGFGDSTADVISATGFAIGNLVASLAMSVHPLGANSLDRARIASIVFSVATQSFNKANRLIHEGGSEDMSIDLYDDTGKTVDFDFRKAMRKEPDA